MMSCTPVTPQVLADYLINLLGDDLGIYRYASGYEDKAICIGDVDEDVDAIGLECVVPLVPDRKSTWLGSTVRVVDRYDILLVEHNNADPKIHSAASKISRAFLKSYGVYSAANTALQSLPQYRVTLEFSEQLGTLNIN